MFKDYIFNLFQQFLIINYFHFLSDEPAIEIAPRYIVNETDKVVLISIIDSNPLSNISWYTGSELLQYHPLAKKTNFTIGKASCTDTKNFTLLASNTVRSNVTAFTELLVNCKFEYLIKIFVKTY